MNNPPITLYEALSLIVYTFSPLTVIVSLYLLYRQTAIFARQTEYVARSLRESQAESMNNQSHEISRIFIEYPELRPYFYYGQPIAETHPNYHRAEAVAELILDILWAMSNQAQRIEVPTSISHDGENLWREFVEDAFGQSPILVQTLLKRQNWYGQAMVEQMNICLKRYAQRVAA